MVGDVEQTRLTLPSLREEIHCLPGPTQHDGAPSWTLHDPASNRFYRIGWLQFEILSRWALADAQAIVVAINAETALQVTDEDVEGFYQFLLGNNLILIKGEQGVQRLWQQTQALKQSLWWRLIHSYLFFRIPLLKPDPLLARIYPYLQWIYSPWCAAGVVGCGITGTYLVSRQWEQFLNTFPYFFNWQGLSQFFLALMLAKVLHELGHALTAHRFGCRVPTMGVAFMAMYPMLYTDASETWKLNARQQRLAIASAGIIAELGLAAVATLVWNFLDDGALRSGVFLLATSTWIMTLVVNLSPFMRFDGYYLLADFLKIENLQARAFEYNRWQLRRWLFAIETPPPEKLTKSMANIFIVYAWGTWLYRFFLFLGIAWMVYQFFFKLLGIFLMAVEIGWFILRPIWRELKFWPTLFKNSRQNWRFLLLIGLLGVVGFMPWQQHIEVPALIKPAHYAELYLPYPARLDHWPFKQGQTVAEGDILAELSSNDLQYKQNNARLEGESLAWQVAFQGFNAERLKQRKVQLSQLESATSKQAGFAKQLQQLQIQSPLAGKVLSINTELQAGQWLKAGEALMIVGDDKQYSVEAYVGEQDIHAIVPNQTALFYPENRELAPLKCLLTHVDDGSSANIPNLLSSTFGGAIATRVDQNKKNIPESAQFRVQLLVADPASQSTISPIKMRGTVKIEIQQSSLVTRFWQQGLAKALRESEF